MPDFKIGDNICWRRTGERATVYGMDAQGRIMLSPNHTLAWSSFFFEHVIEPNSIMKDITSTMKLYFALTNDGNRQVSATAPTKAYDTDAGYDLYCTDAHTVRPGEIKKIPTGIMCAIPKGFYGQVNDRSSMGLKGFKCLAGVIDAGYRGEIIVLMTNLTLEPLLIKAGDKVAQLIVHAIYDGAAELIDVKDLPPAERQNNGFGSSGR